MNELATSPHCTMCLDTGIFAEKYRCPDCCGYGIKGSKLCTKCHGTGYLTAKPAPCPFCEYMRKKHEQAT